MRFAPKAIAWSRKALNLISALHSTSGLGVRPAEYSARKAAKTRSLYSAEKFTASSSMPITSATEAQSTRSWRVEQYSSSSSSSQFFMKRPTTSKPRRFRSSAATDESTPPDMPTTTRSPAIDGLRHAALILPDEFRHARDALLDRGFRGGVGEADVLALPGHARAEMDVGEHGDPGLVEQALPELLRIRGADHAAGLGHVRPGVESAARRLAGSPGHLVQEPHDQVAPHEERVAHLLGGVLGPVDRLDRRPLADMRGAGIGVRHPAHELGAEDGVGGEPDAPAGHRPGLGGAVGDDGAFDHPGQRRSEERRVGK